MNRRERKGRALERAVALIQRAILRGDPKLAGADCTVETNKIVAVDGVRHELDLFVTVMRGSTYQSSHLFECKDWKEPVGKNEVIILAEKVRATGAARGYLVARSFTRDALAQVATDPRLQTINCQDASLGALHLNLLHIVHEPSGVRVSIKERGVPPNANPAVLDWRAVKCSFEGNPTDFVRFVYRHVEKATEEDKERNKSMYRQPSAHHRTQAFKVDFEPGEFLMDGRDIEYMVVDVEFWVQVTSKKICSKLELEGQGRAFSFEPVELDAERMLTIDVVQRLQRI